MAYGGDEEIPLRSWILSIIKTQHRDATGANTTSKNKTSKTQSFLNEPTHIGFDATPFRYPVRGTLRPSLTPALFLYTHCYVDIYVA